MSNTLTPCVAQRVAVENHRTKPDQVGGNKTETTSDTIVEDEAIEDVEQEVSTISNLSLYEEISVIVSESLWSWSPEQQTAYIKVICDTLDEQLDEPLTQERVDALKAGLNILFSEDIPSIRSDTEFQMYLEDVRWRVTEFAHRPLMPPQEKDLIHQQIEQMASFIESQFLEADIDWLDVHEMQARSNRFQKKLIRMVDNPLEPRFKQPSEEAMLREILSEASIPTEGAFMRAIDEGRIKDESILAELKKASTSMLVNRMWSEIMGQFMSAGTLPSPSPALIEQKNKFFEEQEFE